MFKFSLTNKVYNIRNSDNLENMLKVFPRESCIDKILKFNMKLFLKDKLYDIENIFENGYY